VLELEERGLITDKRGLVTGVPGTTGQIGDYAAYAQFRFAILPYEAGALLGAGNVPR